MKLTYIKKKMYLHPYDVWNRLQTNVAAIVWCNVERCLKVEFISIEVYEVIPFIDNSLYNV